MANKFHDFDEPINRIGTDSFKWDYEGENGKYIPLGVADTDFKAPEEAIAAVRKRTEFGVYAYGALPQERFAASICNWYKKRYGLTVDPETIRHSQGLMTGALWMILNAYTRPGDKVLIQAPVYHTFSIVIKGAGRFVESNDLVLEDGRYEMNFEDLEKKVADPRVRIMLICNPHNPVGRVWTEDEVRKIVELCKKYSVWLFSDEIHGDVVLYGHQYTSVARFADVYDHMLVYTAISKTFNMAGLHSSCTIIPNAEYKKIQEDTLRQAWLMSPNCMANSAIEACYTYGDEWVDEQNAYLTENAEFVTSYLKEHAPQIKPVKPEGTYLMWLDCSELSMTSEEIVKILASEYKMAVGGGAGYQGNGEYFLRFNIGCPRETLEKGMEILAQFVADKKGV